MFAMTPSRSTGFWFNPFREMENFQRSFFGTSNPFSSSGSTEPFRVDVSETEEAFILEAEFPGVKKEDVDIRIEENVLTIRARRGAEHENDENAPKYVRAERARGEAVRSFSLSGINEDEISARFENGLLILTLPKLQPEKPAPKKIDIA